MPVSAGIVDLVEEGKQPLGFKGRADSLVFDAASDFAQIEPLGARRRLSQQASEATTEIAGSAEVRGGAWEPGRLARQAGASFREQGEYRGRRRQSIKKRLPVRVGTERHRDFQFHAKLSP